MLLVLPSTLELSTLVILRRGPRDGSELSISGRLSAESRREFGAMANILAFVSREFRRCARLELLARVMTEASSVNRWYRDEVSFPAGLVGEYEGKRISAADIGRTVSDTVVATVFSEISLGEVFEGLSSKGECPEV
jgi:hypothetical protein